MRLKRGLSSGSNVLNLPLIRQKKGSSHFEMIAAFVLFFGFVFFLLVFVKPYKTTTLSGSVVLALYDSFEAETYTTLTSVFLMVDSTQYYEDNSESTCFNVRFPGEIFGFGFSGSLVLSVEGEILNSSIGVDGLLEIQGNETFYQVFISPDFTDEVLSDCGEIPNYVLGSLIDRRLVSYKGLGILKQKYDSDYSGLKDDLRFPQTFEFSITSAEFPELNMEQLIPLNEEVQAKDFLREVLFENGTIVNSRFNFRVW
jgi:hypothetical protein